MKIGSRKASSYVPSPLRPLATRLGLERKRLQHNAFAMLLGARLGIGRGIYHRSGPERVNIGPEELVVLCLVRNGAHWLPTFVRHYQELGAKHIVFLDNGSTDDTVDLVTSYDHVSLFSTSLPFAPYVVALKRWLVQHFGAGGWMLYCDVDELFDYPFSSTLDLPLFLRYLNQRGYTAVVAQMLDMFSGESLSAVQGREESDLREAYNFYDIANIVKTREKYWIEMNRTPSDALYLHTGGIRADAFGWKGSMLTKHPLMRLDGGIRVFPYDDHFVTGACLADVTGLIRHYKFTSRFLEQAREYTRGDRQFNNVGIYTRYREVFSEQNDLCLRGRTARAFRSPEQLLESRFLFASQQYFEWVRTRSDIERNWTAPSQ